MTKFTIHDAREVVSYQLARRIVSKLHMHALACGTKQVYAPYKHPKTGKGTTRLTALSLFNIDTCIEHYTNIIEANQHLNVIPRTKITLKELQDLKET